MVQRAGLEWNERGCRSGGWVISEVVWKAYRKLVLPTILGWERGFISDAIPMVAQPAGTPYTFDRVTKRLSKAD